MLSRGKSCVPVLCAGLHSSGSTWLFNAVAELLRNAGNPGEAGRAPAVGAQFYADGLWAFPDFAEPPDYLVVKTHLADRSLQLLVRLAGGRVLISVREPRDAAASLMTRFGFAFDKALADVAQAAACVLELARIGTPLILRYEDRFFDHEDTLAVLADWLGIAVAPQARARIGQQLSRDAVKATIGTLFEPGRDPADFDPRTHWHPRHVGEARTGFHAEVLEPAQQAEILGATGAFCRYFGYAAALPPESAAPVAPWTAPPVHESLQPMIGFAESSTDAE